MHHPELEKEPNFNFHSDLTIDSHLDTIINEIAKNNSIEGKYIGFGFKISKQYLRGELLYKKATVQQLIELTNHKNPAVRIYAFEALAKNKYLNYKDILDDHKNDKSVIRFQEGCVSWNATVKELLYGISKRELNHVDSTYLTCDEIRNPYKNN